MKPVFKALLMAVVPAEVIRIAPARPRNISPR